MSARATRGRIINICFDSRFVSQWGISKSLFPVRRCKREKNWRRTEKCFYGSFLNWERGPFLPNTLFLLLHLCCNVGEREKPYHLSPMIERERNPFHWSTSSSWHNPLDNQPDFHWLLFSGSGSIIEILKKRGTTFPIVWTTRGMQCHSLTRIYKSTKEKLRESVIVFVVFFCSADNELCVQK